MSLTPGGGYIIPGAPPVVPLPDPNAAPADVVAPDPGGETPAATEPGTPADVPDAEGDEPGEVHPVPRAYSPRGGPLGPLVGGDTLRDAVEATFVERVGSYLAAVAESRPGEFVPPLVGFHDWINQPGISTATPNERPRYVVQTPGMLGPPQRRGDGSYSANYLVRVQLWLYGRSWRDVEDRLSAYLVAARTCLLQNPTLGRVARSTTWRGEAVNPTAATATQGTHTWGQATLELIVRLDPVTNAFAGPAPLDPTAPVPLPGPITESGISITPRSVGISLDAEPLNATHGGPHGTA